MSEKLTYEQLIELYNHQSELLVKARSELQQLGNRCMDLQVKLRDRDIDFHNLQRELKTEKAATNAIADACRTFIKNIEIRGAIKMKRGGKGSRNHVA